MISGYLLSKYSSEIERLFLSKINDLNEITSKSHCCKCTLFLNPKEQQMANEALISNYSFYPDYDGIERKVLCVYSENLSPKFTVDCLFVKQKGDFDLSHRDVLGALMSLNIKRETVGDIIKTEKGFFVFVIDTVAKIIMQELNKVGNVGVSVTETDFSPEMLQNKYTQMRITVSSLRIDAVVSEIINKSRETGQKLVLKGDVKLNFTECSDKAAEIKTGDLISVKGYGRYSVADNFYKTKKGRISVQINKYI